MGDDVHGAVEQAEKSVVSGVEACVADLAGRAASASNAFAIAPTPVFAALSSAFLDGLERVVSDAVAGLQLDPPDETDLVVVLDRELHYAHGLVDGGVVALTLRDAFPDGDWDEEELVVAVLQDRFSCITERLNQALRDWAEGLDARQAERAEAQAPPEPPAPVEPPEPQAPPEAPKPPRVPEPPPAPKAKRTAPRTMPDPEPPTQLEPIRAPRAPSPRDRKARLGLLLSYAGELGVRIKKVPSKPSVAWLDKLQAKLEEIGEKKGIASPFSFTDDSRGTEETMAFVLPQDPTAAAVRQGRIDQMLAKAERAGLKLGSIPDQPSETWLADLEEKLDTAMETRRRERKERREKIARQRKERISRLQQYAGELQVDLGRIPPFPTEDWLSRAERRIAQKMLPEVEGQVDRGRAERLATLLARASDADVELEVPQDPGEVWLGWAESQVDRALGGGAALAIGADPDDVPDTPTILFEEGTVQEQRWALTDERFTIGRSRDNNIQFRHDGQLSRQHCAIEPAGDGYTIQDLRSTQGTRLNSKPVRKPTVLTSGDIITIGETNLVFRLC